ncbi:MAG: DUF2934 domain-containing protein [Nitrospirae bacterium]|nr:DUF2934 domain-containing protein [Nitrospirota bacterium]
MKKHEEIQKVAYDLFERSGRVHGREIDHWLEAERMIRAREKDMHTQDVEASALKKHIPRSDVRKHEARKTGRTKKTAK